MAVNAPPAFHVMIKPCGGSCNLSCQYCFYRPAEALYPDKPLRMSAEILDEFTKQYIESQHVSEVVFAWQGGEPTLMGLDFFEAALECQRKCQRPGLVIRNTLQTNGVLLDDAWCEFLHRHDFLVGISLDGPPEAHDAFRLDKKGRPTFDTVMRGLALLQRHQVELNVLACVHAANAGRPLEVYEFLRDTAGARFIQFIPVVERASSIDKLDSPVTARSVSGRQFGDFLIAIFDEWVKRDVGRVFVQAFDAALAAWFGSPPSLCVFAPTCGTAVVLEHNGDVYSCDHFVDSAHLLGNIRDRNIGELVGSEQQRRFGLVKREALPRYCQDCEVMFACHGGCPKDRVLTTPTGEPGLNCLCSGYKAFFNHIREPMETMASLLRKGRAPAEIMVLSR
jgi:uncharacterized protein